MLQFEGCQATSGYTRGSSRVAPGRTRPKKTHRFRVRNAGAKTILLQTQLKQVLSKDRDGIKLRLVKDNDGEIDFHPIASNGVLLDISAPNVSNVALH